METIAAISTPHGKGGVALIRISGDEAIRVAARVFTPYRGGEVSGRSLTDAPSRVAVYGAIHKPGREVPGGAVPGGTAPFGAESSGSDSEGAASAETIDMGICTLFRAPHSFTGEDTAEISCHGGWMVTFTVLTAVLTAGARQAEAGEFTRRAFLNGKMSLSAAESLGMLLEAKTEEQMRLSLSGMRGILSERTEGIYRDMTHVLSSVFVCIDYPDEDLAEMSRGEMISEIRSIKSRLDALAATWRTGRAVMEGIPTVICGRTNAGKSSLYNLLTGREAAIVTDIAGTTRDVLTETLSLGRVTLRVSDTAGIRETDDRVEQIGVERALRELDAAGLILAVFDVSAPLAGEDLSFIARLHQPAADRSVPVIAIANKADRSTDDAAEKVLAEAFAAFPAPHAVIPFSAKYGTGLDVLTATVASLFTDGSLDTATDAILGNARQYAAVSRSLDATDNALSALEAGLPVDLACDDLSAAMSALSELDGKSVSDDVVADIFSRFCVGK